MKKILDKSQNTLENWKDILYPYLSTELIFRKNKEKIDTFPDKPIIMYVGKITYGQNLYDEDFWKGLLQSLQKHSISQEVVIRYCPDFSYLLNPSDSEKVMTIEEEKVYISQMVHKYLPSHPVRLEHPRTLDRHSDLFDALYTQGLAALNVGELPDLTPETNSLDLARFLFLASQKNESVFKRFIQMKPAELKNDRGNHDYYAVCELAMRLLDFVHGDVIQGGEKRQEIYDRLILEIFYNTWKSGHPFEILQRRLLDSVTHVDFYSLYFDKQARLSNQDLIHRKHTWSRRLIQSVAMASTVLVSILAMQTLNHVQHQKKTKKIQKDLIANLVQDDDILLNVSPLDNAYLLIQDPDKKAELVKAQVNSLEHIFSVQYGTIGDMSIEELHTMFLDNLSMDDMSEFYRRGAFDHERTRQKVLFLRKFVEHNKFALAMHNIPLKPYEYLHRYESTFREILQNPSAKDTNAPSHSSVTGASPVYVQKTYYTRYGEGLSYDFKGGDFMHCHNPNDTKKLLVDYFIQTYSRYATLEDMIQNTFFSHVFGFKKSYEYYTHSIDTIFTDLILHHHDQILNMQDSALYNFLQKVVYPQYKTLLDHEPAHAPVRGALSKNMSALDRSRSFSLEDNKLPYVINKYQYDLQELGVLYIFDYSNNFIPIEVALATIDGKEYIYTRRINSDDGEYSLEHVGRIVL